MATRHSPLTKLRRAREAVRIAFASTCTLGVAAGSLLASPVALAGAQPLCSTRGAILERLETAYGEKRQAIGLSADGGVLEILASSDGSWTILITYPGRPTCMLAVGQAWENLALQLVGKPA